VVKVLVNSKFQKATDLDPSAILIDTTAAFIVAVFYCAVISCKVVISLLQGMSVVLKNCFRKQMFGYQMASCYDFEATMGA